MPAIRSERSRCLAPGLRTAPPITALGRRCGSPACAYRVLGNREHDRTVLQSSRSSPMPRSAEPRLVRLYGTQLARISRGRRRAARGLEWTRTPAEKIAQLGLAVHASPPLRAVCRRSRIAWTSARNPARLSLASSCRTCRRGQGCLHSAPPNLHDSSPVQFARSRPISPSPDGPYFSTTSSLRHQTRRRPPPATATIGRA